MLSLDRSNKIITIIIEPHTTVAGFQENLNRYPDCDLTKIKHIGEGCFIRAVFHSNYNLMDYIVKKWNNREEVINLSDPSGATLLSSRIQSLSIITNITQPRHVLSTICQLLLLGAKTNQIIESESLLTRTFIKSTQERWMKWVIINDRKALNVVSNSHPEAQERIALLNKTALFLIWHGAESQKFALLQSSLSDKQSVFFGFPNDVIKVIKETYVASLGQNMLVYLSNLIRNHRLECNRFMQLSLGGISPSSPFSSLHHELLHQVQTKYAELN